MLKLIALFTSTCLAVIQQSCLAKSTTIIGSKSLGVSFSDLNQLIPQESSDINLKLDSVKVCQRQGSFSGIQLLTTQFNTTSSKIIRVNKLNEIGDVSNNTNCQLIQLDDASYIRLLQVQYDNSQIRGIQIYSSDGQSAIISKQGNFKTFSFNFQQEKPLIGFYGSEIASGVVSLAPITQIPRCKVLTTLEIISPLRTFLPIPEEDFELTMIIGLAGLGGLLLYAVLGAIAFHFKDKYANRGTIGDCKDPSDE